MQCSEAPASQPASHLQACDPSGKGKAIALQFDNWELKSGNRSGGGGGGNGCDGGLGGANN
ncbi:hypothetical protein TYRP_002642 [Tyrophagus putrescentiae]|nr:hypothetical protein TYRP_002642 [Tyrophagus putrescentiae]